MIKVDFTDLYRDWYYPPGEEIHLVDLPTVQYLTLDLPPESNQQAFLQIFDQLLNFAAALNTWYYSGHKPEGYFDYQLPPMEAIRNQKPVLWTWPSQLLLMTPNFVQASALQQLLAEYDTAAQPAIYLQSFQEGKCIQLLHTGAFGTEAGSLQHLSKYAAVGSLRLSDHLHEIYLNDPREVAPEEMRRGLGWGGRAVIRNGILYIFNCACSLRSICDFSASKWASIFSEVCKS